MLKNKYFRFGLPLLALVVLYYTFLADKDDSTATDLSAPVNVAAYREQLTTERQKKDRFLRTSTDSPIPDKASFKGLLYFDPDPAYRVTARLEPFADKSQKLVVRMSDGSEEVYDKFAHAVFSLNGEANRLLIVKQDKTHIILFRDATSGKETYGGGRYLELDPAGLTDNRALLDFNTAYNPYCAYNPGYACPLPPKENALSVAVRVGERYVAHEE